MAAKYKIGDHVTVITYGALAWFKKDEAPKKNIVGQVEDIVWVDILPEIVGKTGIITKIINLETRPQYSLDGIPEKISWYEEGQLELKK